MRSSRHPEDNKAVARWTSLSTGRRKENHDSRTLTHMLGKSKNFQASEIFGNSDELYVALQILQRGYGLTVFSRKGQVLSKKYGNDFIS